MINCCTGKNDVEQTTDEIIDRKDFTFNRLCVKLFKTGSIDVVKDCLSCSVIDLPNCICKKVG